MWSLLKKAGFYLYQLRKALRPVCLHFIFFVFCTDISFAQDGIIHGIVKDGKTVLPSATISIANKTFLTKDSGEFSITLKPGTYKLIITHVGYNKIEQTIILNQGETKSIQFNMVRDEQLSAVVVTYLGSRSFIQRSNLKTAVPVDRITSKELIQTGQPSLIQMLNFTAPSFNVSRQHLTEPVTLRGLSPDHVLILINGTRYHSNALINEGSIRGTLGRGSVGNDLSSIPFPAIEKIEILRDDASAQYGSEAIAGVMNFELKKTTGKTFINLHLGQQYKGDGEGIVFGINRGIRLNKGFLNFSGDFRYRKPTYRGGEYLGTVYKNYRGAATRQDSLRIKAMDDSTISAKGFSRKTPVSNDGNIQLTNSGFLVNGGYPINSQIELFWTGAVNYRHPVNHGVYRYPKDSNQVNGLLYPDGFKPIIIINSCDISGIAGARGKTSKGWNWEWNSVYGKKTSQVYLENSNNASQFALLGANAPTDFYCGSYDFMQQTNTINLTRDFANEISGIKTFNVGFGAEYRFENFKTGEGEEASWENYDASKKTQWGAQPTPGINPEDVVNASRRVAGLYVDLETDINDQLLINMAVRYENYNDFGNNLAGKLAMRYKLSPAFSLRGSASNGYHAPGLQQIYYSATQSGSRGANIPIRIRIFNNNSPMARAFGVDPLQPEKAVNLSGGFTSTILPHINMTVDAYWIQIKNRIVLSGIFDRITNPDVDRILKDRPDIDQVRFITNAINTKTRGIDIVMNGNWKVSKASLGFMLAANFTRTNIFGPIQLADSLKVTTTNTNTLFNREEKEKIENGQPGSKIILSANYQIGKFEFLIRNTRFGNTSAVYSSEDKSRDEFFSAKILTDAGINYSPKTWLTITAGANNIFNVYPDRLKNYSNTTLGILIYSNEAMQFGYNGGYYFVNMAFTF